MSVRVRGQGDINKGAANHALNDIPEDRVRYHLCWGSWHGPHTHDLPFEHIIGLMLQVKARNARYCTRAKMCAGRDADG